MIRKTVIICYKHSISLQAQFVQWVREFLKMHIKVLHGIILESPISFSHPYSCSFLLWRMQGNFHSGSISDQRRHLGMNLLGKTICQLQNGIRIWLPPAMASLTVVPHVQLSSPALLLLQLQLPWSWSKKWSGELWHTDLGLRKVNDNIFQGFPRCSCAPDKIKRMDKGIFQSKVSKHCPVLIRSWLRLSLCKVQCFRFNEPTLYDNIAFHSGTFEKLHVWLFDPDWTDFSPPPPSQWCRRIGNGGFGLFITCCLFQSFLPSQEEDS